MGFLGGWFTVPAADQTASDFLALERRWSQVCGQHPCSVLGVQLSSRGLCSPAPRRDGCTGGLLSPLVSVPLLHDCWLPRVGGPGISPVCKPASHLVIPRQPTQVMWRSQSLWGSQANSPASQPLPGVSTVYTVASGCARITISASSAARALHAPVPPDTCCSMSISHVVF